MPIPDKLQSRLWSKSTESLDPQQDQNYVIKQLLHYGTLEDLYWLLKQYPLSTIQNAYEAMKKDNPHPSVTRFIGLFLRTRHDPF